MQNIGFSRCSLWDVSCLEFLASIDCHASAILSMTDTSILRNKQQLQQEHARPNIEIKASFSPERLRSPLEESAEKYIVRRFFRSGFERVGAGLRARKKYISGVTSTVTTNTREPSLHLTRYMHKYPNRRTAAYIGQASST